MLNYGIYIYRTEDRWRWWRGRSEMGGSVQLDNAGDVNGRKFIPLKLPLDLIQLFLSSVNCAYVAFLYCVALSYRALSLSFSGSQHIRAAFLVLYHHSLIDSPS